MKKLIMYLGLAVLVILTPSSCSSNSDKIDLEALRQSVFEHKNQDDYINLTLDELSVYFSIDSKDVDDMLIYISSDGTKADEIAVCRAVDYSALDRIKSSFNDRLEERRTSFKNYIPAEYDKLVNVQVNESGLYCFYTVGFSQDIIYEAINSNPV